MASIWGGSSAKPYTAVSVQIDRMTGEQYEEDDLSGLIDLIEVVRIQASGPTEAARAIRKKLKYGSPHRQLRALVILDGLIQNAGSRFQKTFADEPLLERLRIMARDDTVDPAVRQKCNLLFRQWAVAYKDTPGMSSINALHKTLPQPKRRPQRQTKSLRETEIDSDDARQAPHTHARNVSGTSASGSSPKKKAPVTLDQARIVGLPSSSFGGSSKASKKSKGGIKFNLASEKPQIMQTIAQSSVSSTNLLNALQLINREHERVSENPEVANRFETCKNLRRQVLRYIQLVENDELVGSLLNANDELVKALTAYDVMDRSMEDDSDSDQWENPEDFKDTGGAAGQLKGLKLDDMPPAKPSRPVARQASEDEEEDESEEEVDENDPFADSHAAPTPGVEKSGMNWKDV
ncbi:Protein lsb5 [Sphaceloma murrayae]|uniref:Protein lsb5 n=1 Tax=Sphaceloma murrayae TaxID=2082308 RepID=A0A2K1QIF9_9PEZI|nr:Protein lsb5 [Sphaceloma murrayae]